MPEKRCYRQLGIGQATSRELPRRSRQVRDREYQVNPCGTIVTKENALLLHRSDLVLLRPLRDCLALPTPTSPYGLVFHCCFNNSYDNFLLGLNCRPLHRGQDWPTVALQVVWHSCDRRVPFDDWVGRCNRRYCRLLLYALHGSSIRPRLTPEKRCSRPVGFSSRSHIP